MSAGRFTRPRPFPRPADLSPAARGIERAKWREFVAQALDHGQRAADGAEHDKAALWELTRHAHSTGTTPFPVDGASAARMARSLAELAGALVGVAVTGVRRVALGHAVVGLARGLDVLLHEAAAEEFRATSGRQFKDD